MTKRAPSGQAPHTGETPVGAGRARGHIVSRWLVGFVLLALALVPTVTAAEESAAQKDSILDALRAATEDGEKSTLAAQTFLQTMLDGTTPAAERYRRFLGDLLAPENLSRNERDVPVAEKTIFAMGYLASTGKIFPGGTEKLLGLLGVGPASLRQAVRKALLSIVRSEKEQSSGVASPTFQALGDRLLTNSPPSREILGEISLVLLEVDPMALVGFLIDGMVKNGGAGARDGNIGVYVLQLREMLLLDLQKVEEWSAWWQENRARSYLEIVADSRRKFRDGRVQLWRRTFQRIRESGNPERYLSALTDTFEMDFTRDVRVAVLEALGAFPAWLRDTRFPDEIPGVGVLDDAGKAKFIERATSVLLAVIDDSDRRHLCGEVERSALAALRQFNGFVGRSSKLEEAVVRVLLVELKSSVEAPLAGGGAEPEAWRAAAREYGLELIRAVGGLRLVDPDIGRILKGILRRGPGVWPFDERLVTETVLALGRVLQRSFDAEVIDLFLRLHDTPGGEPGKTLRELRGACVAGLNVPIADPETRERVRQLHVRILADPEETAERISAIIGLGILARAGDAESIDSLTDVLAGREQFEPSEVVAVIDALAYLGDRKALGCFLGFLSATDKPFAEQVWQKIGSILKGGNPELLAWLIGELERWGFEEDLRESAVVVVRLAMEPELRDFVSESKFSFEDGESFVRCWECLLATVHAFEVLGREAEAMKRVGQFAEVILKNERAKVLRPEIESEIVVLEKRLQEKIDLRSDIKKGNLKADDLLAALERIVLFSGATARDRWRGLHWVGHVLQGLPVPEERSRLVGQFVQALAGATLASVWEGIPPNHRERFCKRLRTAGKPAAETTP